MDQLRPWLEYFAQELRTPGGAVCWNMLSSNLNPGFVETMEDYLEGSVDAPNLLDKIPVFRF